jgi:type IV pilus assembly protein PilP
MKSLLVLVRTFICLMGLALLPAGCADSDLAAVQPQVVRKKLVSPPEGGLPPVQSAALPAPAPVAPAAEPGPVVATAQKQGTTPPSPNVNPPVPPNRSGGRAAAAQPIAEPILPVVATPPPVAAPEPQARPLQAALAATDSQVAALLNLRAQALYDPKGKADPFEPLLRDEATPNQAGKLMRKQREAQSPLEKIDLGQLKLVAIIAAPSGNLAMVQESSGKGYILRKGTYIGLNSGKIVDIASDKVLVEEEFEDVYGKTIIQKKEITLPKPPGEL